MIAAAFLSSAIDTDKSVEIGKAAPKIETVEGTNVVVDANSEAKTKVISFWSPKKAASRISNRNLAMKYGNDNPDTEFISICTDSDETLMREVMKIDGVNGSPAYSYSEISPRTFKDYDAEKNPRAFKISPEGRIVEII